MHQNTTLIGRLGADPKELDFGVKFSVAVTRGWKDENDEWQEATTWFDMLAKGFMAEKVKQWGKGDLVLIDQADLTVRKDDDKIYYNWFAKSGRRINKVGGTAGEPPPF